MPVLATSTLAGALLGAVQLAPALGVVITTPTTTRTITWGPCPVVVYAPTTAVVPVAQTVSAATPSTLTLTATLYNISGFAPTTYEWWTPTPADPGTTSTDVVLTLQCRGTSPGFVLTEPTTVATSTDRATTTTVTHYPSTIATTATDTVSYFA